MQTNYLKEMFTSMDGKNSLAVLNPKQMNSSLNYAIKKILEQNALIIVSMTKSAENLILELGEKKDNVFIIDVFSRESRFVNGTQKNVIYISNPADLTQIQIAIEKGLKVFPNAITIFDSLGVLAVYSDERLFEKFIYLFTNKMNLQGKTVVFYAIKDSIDNEVLSMIKQFCEKNYDFSDLYIESIELTP